MQNPLVSIGIPTYNRPEGLARALNMITKQTYKNIEIIVSDNCSPGDSTDNLIKVFITKDSRIKYFKQEENKGIIHNFYFVLNKATSNYFMWAPDDDYFESNDLIEKLIKYAPDYSLTFTNYHFISPEKTRFNFFTPVYNNCHTRMDYIFAFCRSGAGHPSCGMFNLILLKQAGIELRFEEDLSYHMEGLLLHRIFNYCKVKYVDDAVINYNTKSREYESLVPVRKYKDFLFYTKRLFKFYLFKSDHSFKNKVKILRLIFNCHYYHYKALLKNKPKINGIGKMKFMLRIITV